MKQINSSSWFLLLISSSNEIILYMKYLQLMLPYNPPSGLRLAKTVFEALFRIRPCARYPNFFDLKNNQKNNVV